MPSAIALPARLDPCRNCMRAARGQSRRLSGGDDQFCCSCGSRVATDHTRPRRCLARVSTRQSPARMTRGARQAPGQVVLLTLPTLCLSLSSCRLLSRCLRLFRRAFSGHGCGGSLGRFRSRTGFRRHRLLLRSPFRRGCGCGLGAWRLDRLGRRRVSCDGSNLFHTLCRCRLCCLQNQLARRWGWCRRCACGSSSDSVRAALWATALTR